MNKIHPLAFVAGGQGQNKIRMIAKVSMLSEGAQHASMKYTSALHCI